MFCSSFGVIVILLVTSAVIEADLIHDFATEEAVKNEPMGANPKGRKSRREEPGQNEPKREETKETNIVYNKGK